MTKQEAIKELREILEPGDTVYCILRHRSQSGMSRVIDLFTIKDNKPRRLGYWAAVATGSTHDRKRDGVKVGGCGMDMGFALVYDLSRVLFPDGFGEVGEASLYPQGIRAGSKEHAEKLQSSGVVFRGRNGDPSGWDNDGGYALKHEWI